MSDCFDSCSVVTDHLDAAADILATPSVYQLGSSSLVPPSVLLVRTLGE